MIHLEKTEKEKKVVTTGRIWGNEKESSRHTTGKHILDRDTLGGSKNSVGPINTLVWSSCAESSEKAAGHS